MPLILERVLINSHEFYIPAGSPAQEVDLDLGGSSDPDIHVWYGNHWGTQMHPGDEIDISFKFWIYQEAPEGETLTFEIQLIGIQWNLYAKWSG